MIVFFQNYFTPYRHALFERFYELGVDFCVVYAQLPEDEGRKWKIQPGRYKVLQSKRFLLGRQVLFFAKEIFCLKKVDTVVLLDNTPTNLVMLLIGFFFVFLKRSRAFLWLEHIPGKRSSFFVGIYQWLMSVLLILVSNKLILLSKMSLGYVNRLHMLFSRPFFVVPQAVPKAEIDFDFRVLRSLSRIERKVVFGFLGSADPRKNLQSLIVAFELLLEKYPARCELVVGGCKSTGFAHQSKNIRFLGYLAEDEREKFFNEIDVLVLPSLHDPWGLVVNEAVDRGVLPLVSRGCGSSELVSLIDEKLVVDCTVVGLFEGLNRCMGLKVGDWEVLYKKFENVSSSYSIDKSAEVLLSGLVE